MASSTSIRPFLTYTWFLAQENWKSEIIWHLGLFFRYRGEEGLKQAWMVEWTLSAECCAGWKHHVDVRLISRLSITRHYCDANDGTDCCKARRHGNSLLLQRHPVVVWWCLWRLSVRGGETSCHFTWEYRLPDRAVTACNNTHGWLYTETIWGQISAVLWDTSWETIRL